jgi:hypothetical protein
MKYETYNDAIEHWKGDKIEDYNKETLSEVSGLICKETTLNGTSHLVKQYCIYYYKLHKELDMTPNEFIRHLIFVIGAEIVDPILLTWERQGETVNELLKNVGKKYNPKLSLPSHGNNPYYKVGMYNQDIPLDLPNHNNNHKIKDIIIRESGFIIRYEKGNGIGFIAIKSKPDLQSLKYMWQFIDDTIEIITAFPNCEYEVLHTSSIKGTEFMLASIEGKDKKLLCIKGRAYKCDLTEIIRKFLIDNLQSHTSWHPNQGYLGEKPTKYLKNLATK